MSGQVAIACFTLSAALAPDSRSRNAYCLEVALEGFCAKPAARKLHCLEAIPAADRVVCDAPQAAILRAALGNAAVQFRSQRIREIGNTATGAAKAAGSLGA